MKNLKILILAVVLFFGTFISVAPSASALSINELVNRNVLIENQETRRYLFPYETSKGGVLKKIVVGVDSNYYDRALWKIIPVNGDSFVIENQKEKRYLFSDGSPIKEPRGSEGFLRSSPIISLIEGPQGSEGGWLASSGFASPKVVGADENYYNRALWKIIPSDNSFVFENQETKRYLLSEGMSPRGPRGSEREGTILLMTPKVVGADENYYNRALWKIIPREPRSPERA